MIRIEHNRERDLIILRTSGTLTTQDYIDAIPELEHVFEATKGPLRVLIHLEDFRGWEIGALWHELELDLEYRGDCGRIAVLGETHLKKWGSTLAAPFAKAEMKFFPIEREADAEAWLAETPDENDAKK
ncbi:STAS/SEC14 domain-containing protein [Ruegeria marina]|uniref:SpoIIAA-like n=1 Tax=Ruegeria marina TaxID=639004 RepID=A0A1G6I790_9RHOB|nr:STAS/SEC14 domain-containing protein [Ruegeria marina]SDC02298.1 SpoIIAA-like [Ruegeria marina]